MLAVLLGYATVSQQKVVSGASCTVLYTMFYGITGVASGAGICASSCSLTITNCGFYGCVVSHYGGGFYLNAGSLDLSRSCFVRCATGFVSDDGGNAFESYNAPATVQACMTHQSAPTPAQGGDSVFHIKHGLMQVQFINDTDCCGRSGSSGGSFWYVSAGSYYKYSSIVDIADCATIEVRYSSCDLIRLNFVNITRNSPYMFYGLSNTKMLFTECVFINIPNTYDTSMNTGTFQNCYADPALSYVPGSKGVQTYAYQLMSKCALQTDHFTPPAVFHTEIVFESLFFGLLIN